MEAGRLKPGRDAGQQSASGQTLIPSPYQSVSHNRHDHLAHKMGGPEMGAHTQCKHDATCGGGKMGK